MIQRLLIGVLMIVCTGCFKTAGVNSEQTLLAPLADRQCMERAIEATEGTTFLRSIEFSNVKNVYPKGSVIEKHYTYRYEISGMQKPKDRVAHLMVVEDTDYASSKVQQTHVRNRFKELASSVSEDDKRVAKEVFSKLNESIQKNCGLSAFTPEAREF